MNKNKIILSVIALALSFGLGYFATPTKIETKEVVKVQIQKEEAKTKIVYRDKVTKPDGTIIEKEVEKEQSSSKEKSDSESIAERIETKDLGLVVSALAVKDIKDLTGETGGQLVISMRILGAAGLSTSVTVYKKEILGAVGFNWSF